MVTGDGARTPMGGVEMVNGHTQAFLTGSFERYDRRTNRLERPNGVVIEYALKQAILNRRYPTRVTDPFGNTLEYQYEPASGGSGFRITTITQDLHGGQVRQVIFGWQGDKLTSVSDGRRTWVYGWTGEWLTTVTLPTGLAWTFSYHDAVGNPVLTATMPSGGQVVYSFDRYEHPCSVDTSTSCYTRVVTARDASGPDIPAGHWTFEYSSTAPGEPYSRTVHGPGGAKVAYSGDTPPNFAYMKRDTYQDGALRETETVLSFEIQTGWSLAPYPNYPNNLPQPPAPPSVFPPQFRTTVRDGHTYGVTYLYHCNNAAWCDYGEPYLIDLTGDDARTITRTFRHDFGTRYIRGKIASET
ncbi:MAG: hypothetical protein NTV05_07815, partial [Acidobacteria bacterium]|nr:hypothetical protein [Acidobacteriota bacterium]